MDLMAEPKPDPATRSPDPQSRPEPARPRQDRLVQIGLETVSVSMLALIAAGWWAVLNIVPDEIRLDLGGRALSVGNIRNKILGNASLLFLTLPLVLFIEAAIVGWQGSSTRQMLLDRTPSVKTDMIYLLLGQARITDIFGRVLTLGVAMISGGLVREAIRARTGFAVDPGAIPLLAQVVPRLLELGINPYTYEYATVGYPRAAQLERAVATRARRAWCSTSGVVSGARRGRWPSCAVAGSSAST